MRQIKDPILFTLFLLVCGCATHGTSEVSVTTDKPALTKPQADKWQMMVGKWYGDQQTSEGGRKEWIDHRKNDGTYVIQFRITSKDGEVQQSVEAGEWGVSGPIYFSIFKAWVYDGRQDFSDATDPYNRDAYEIISLTEDAFEYLNYDSGNKYKTKRVSDAFSF